MEGFKILQENRPELFQAVMQLKSTIDSKSTLDEKTRNLIIVSIQTALNNASAARSHALLAKKAGASKDEIIDAIVTIIPAIGLPPVMEVLPEVIKVIE